MYVPDEKYKEFLDKLTDSRFEKKGIRLPELRKFAKQIIKNNRWEDFIKEEHSYFEDVMTLLFVIAEAPIDTNKRFILLEEAFFYLDNWGFVDSLCSTLKETKKNIDIYWEWLQSIRFHENPFVVRFVYVMYLNYFLDTPYFDEILFQFEKDESDHYYIKMAIAWAVSCAFIKDKDKTILLFQNQTLPKWTHNKAIQKIRESLRVDKTTKDFLKTLKK